MDRSGYLPAIDDAHNFLRPWLAPFYIFERNTDYVDYTNRLYRLPNSVDIPLPQQHIPDNTGDSPFYTGIVKRFITWPAEELIGASLIPEKKFPITNWSGGVGKIRSFGTNGNIDITMIGEFGSTLTEGASHDQQDNGSIEINFSQGNERDRIVLDPGYHGFSQRHNTSRYSSHNVVLVNGNGINSNGTITDDEIKQRVTTIFGVKSAIIRDMIFDQIKESMPAGSPARDIACGGGSVLENKKFLNGIETKYNYDVGTSSIQRGIIIHDGEVFVLDIVKSEGVRIFV